MAFRLSMCFCLNILYIEILRWIWTQDGPCCWCSILLLLFFALNAPSGVLSSIQTREIWITYLAIPQSRLQRGWAAQQSQLLWQIWKVLSYGLRITISYTLTRRIDFESCWSSCRPVTFFRSFTMVYQAANNSTTNTVHCALKSSRNFFLYAGLQLQAFYSSRASWKRQLTTRTQSSSNAVVHRSPTHSVSWCKEVLKSVSVSSESVFPPEFLSWKAIKTISFQD